MKRKKILIVEDEFVGALSLADLLDLWGYEVCEIASTGEDAIAWADGAKPDIILMDVNLHGQIDGIHAAKEITNRSFIPVVFMTGYEVEKIREQLESMELSGQFHILSKPIDLGSLETILASL